MIAAFEHQFGIKAGSLAEALIAEMRGCYPTDYMDFCLLGSRDESMCMRKMGKNRKHGDISPTVDKLLALKESLNEAKGCTVTEILRAPIQQVEDCLAGVPVLLLLEPVGVALWNHRPGVAV